MLRIQDCLQHGWENPTNKELERLHLSGRSNIESEEEMPDTENERVKNEVDLIQVRDVLGLIGYKKVSQEYDNGVIINRFIKGEKAIHLEFGHKDVIFGEE